MAAKGQAWGWRWGRTGKGGSPSQKRVPRPGVTPTPPTSRTGPGHGMEGERPWAGARGLGKVLAGSTEAGKGTEGWGGVGVGQTWLSSPRKISMMKKRQDHSWDRGIMVTALGKAMKARPGPAGHTQHQGGPPARTCARVCLPACAG